MVGHSDHISQILKILKTGQTFCLIGHQNPDADVIGGQIALSSFIKRMGPGKKISLFNCGQIPRYLSFLQGFEEIQSVEKVDGLYDVLISLECSSGDRMGRIFELKTQAKQIINLDHHMSNSMFGTVNWVDAKASSLAEIIFKIIDSSGLPMTRSEAMALYVGMVTDTGCFRYGNTTRETHKIAAALLEHELPIGDISERIYMSRTSQAMKLFSYTFQHLTYECGERLTHVSIPQTVIDGMAAQPDDMEEIVNVGLQQASVQVAVLFREGPRPGDVKVSFRSKGQIDIHAIAKKHGGGGHKNAAGCTLNGSIDSVIALVLPDLKGLF